MICGGDYFLEAAGPPFLFVTRFGKTMHPHTLQELFANLGNALVLYARQWCKSPEDAVQEAFMDLARCSPEPNSPKAWLYTATRRKAQNIARAESRHRNHLEQMVQSKDGTRAMEHWLQPQTRNGIDASEVLAGLGALDGDQREMIVAKVWGELSFEELGELMNCSASSAYRRYTAALTELKSIVLAEDARKDITTHARNTK
jgi:RNA polymerase sigma-70 factor (ECF subfamily)